MKNAVKPILCQIGIYIVQFLILPAIPGMFEFQNGDDEIIALIIISTTAIAAATGMSLFSDKFRFWLVGIIPYFALIHLYHPDGIYGINDSGILGGIAALFASVMITLVVLITEFIVWLLIKTIKRLITRAKTQ
jgi:hypothetical protein